MSSGEDHPTLFLADWTDALFIHFAVRAGELREKIPFQLELFDGLAWVSLVAFTQRRLRPVMGGRLGELLSAPLASHAFLNLRTYVNVDGEPGIYFLAEWIPNRLAALIGPAVYGLPYRLGKLAYHCDRIEGTFHGHVSAGGSSFRFSARNVRPERGEIAGAGCVDEFLLERYVAFTHFQGVSRRFEISHDPWRPVAARVQMEPSSLVDAFPWLRDVPAALAHFSRGVTGVRIGPPRRIENSRHNYPENPSKSAHFAR
ncbi:MAG: DUF2071 domain-containing protein [Tepidisphaeraceae bacterium]